MAYKAKTKTTRAEHRGRHATTSVSVYQLRVLVQEFRQVPLVHPHTGYRQEKVGEHWATVEVQFNEQKFRMSSLLGRLKNSKTGKATVADGTLTLTITHDKPLSQGVAQ